MAQHWIDFWMAMGWCFVLGASATLANVLWDLLREGPPPPPPPPRPCPKNPGHHTEEAPADRIWCHTCGQGYSPGFREVVERVRVRG